jgi:hypothetical protein
LRSALPLSHRQDLFHVNPRSDTVSRCACSEAFFGRSANPSLGLHEQQKQINNRFAGEFHGMTGRRRAPGQQDEPADSSRCGPIPSRDEKERWRRTITETATGPGRKGVPPVSIHDWDCISASTYDPLVLLPQVPSFTLKSPELSDGGTLRTEHLFNGRRLERGKPLPCLEWSGFPASTRSLVVACHDPRVPTSVVMASWEPFITESQRRPVAQ